MWIKPKLCWKWPWIKEDNMNLKKIIIKCLNKYEEEQSHVKHFIREEFQKKIIENAHKPQGNVNNDNENNNNENNNNNLISNNINDNNNNIMESQNNQNNQQQNIELDYLNSNNNNDNNMDYKLMKDKK